MSQKHPSTQQKLLRLDEERGRCAREPPNTHQRTWWRAPARLTKLFAKLCSFPTHASRSKPLRLDEEQGNVLWDDNPVYIGVHGGEHPQS